MGCLPEAWALGVLQSSQVQGERLWRQLVAVTTSDGGGGVCYTTRGLAVNGSGGQTGRGPGFSYRWGLGRPICRLEAHVADCRVRPGGWARR